jgi:hypothetical protein
MKKSYNEENHNLFFSPNVNRAMKSREIDGGGGGGCVTRTKFYGGNCG